MVFNEDEIINYLKLNNMKEIYINSFNDYLKEFGNLQEISSEMLKNKILTSKSGSQIISLIKFFLIEKTEVNLYWIAKLYFCLPLYSSWKKIYKSVNEINFMYNKNKCKYPPFILYLFYLVDYNRNNNNKIRKINNSKFHYFKKKNKFIKENLNSMFDKEKEIKKSNSINNQKINKKFIFKDKSFKKEFNYINIKKNNLIIKNKIFKSQNENLYVKHKNGYDYYNIEKNKKMKKYMVKNLVNEWSLSKCAKHTNTLNKIEYYNYNSQFNKRQYMPNKNNKNFKNVNPNTINEKFKTTNKYNIFLSNNNKFENKLNIIKKDNLLKIKNKNLININEDKFDNVIIQDNKDKIISVNNLKNEKEYLNNLKTNNFDFFLSKNENNFDNNVKDNEILKNTFNKTFFKDMNKTNSSNFMKNKINYITKTSFFKQSADNFYFTNTSNNFYKNENIKNIKETLSKKNLFQSYDSLNKALNQVTLADYNPDIKLPKKLNLLSLKSNFISKDKKNKNVKKKGKK